MGVEENKAVVRRLVEEFLNQGRVEVVDEIFAPDFVDHQGALGPTGTHDDVKAFVATITAAFSGLRFQIDQLFAEGDNVVVLVTSRGKHTGEFNGVPATGRDVTIAGMSITRIANGKIAERWNITDMAGLMAQIS